jgi:hypothetical protein
MIDDRSERARWLEFMQVHPSRLGVALSARPAATAAKNWGEVEEDRPTREQVLRELDHDVVHTELMKLDGNR